MGGGSDGSSSVATTGPCSNAAVSPSKPAISASLAVRTAMPGGRRRRCSSSAATTVKRRCSSSKATSAASIVASTAKACIAEWARGACVAVGVPVLLLGLAFHTSCARWQFQLSFPTLGGSNQARGDKQQTGSRRNQGEVDSTVMLQIRVCWPGPSPNLTAALLSEWWSAPPPPRADWLQCVHRSSEPRWYARASSPSTSEPTRRSRQAPWRTSTSTCLTASDAASRTPRRARTPD